MEGSVLGTGQGIRPSKIWHDGQIRGQISPLADSVEMTWLGTDTVEMTWGIERDQSSISLIYSALAARLKFGYSLSVAITGA